MGRAAIHHCDVILIVTVSPVAAVIAKCSAPATTFGWGSLPLIAGMQFKKAMLYCDDAVWGGLSYITVMSY